MRKVCTHDLAKVGIRANGRCKSCSKEVDNNYYRKNSQKRLLQQMDYCRSKFYGISKKDYENLLLKQNNCCAICKCIPINEVLSVDHDHLTGKVRGLLCRKCNLLLGCAKDSVAALISATSYLTN